MREGTCVRLIYHARVSRFLFRARFSFRFLEVKKSSGSVVQHIPSFPSAAETPSSLEDTGGISCDIHHPGREAEPGEKTQSSTPRTSLSSPLVGRLVCFDGHTHLTNGNAGPVGVCMFLTASTRRSLPSQKQCGESKAN